MADRKKLEREDYDVIVVGAGTGGLTAAALLAKRGKRVLVVDQHYVAGGNGTVFKRRGYEFDVGIHYLGGCDPSGQIPRILRGAGASVEFEEMDPDGFDTYVFPDFEFRVPKGIEPFRRRLYEVFPKEKAGIDRYLNLLQQVREIQTIAANPVAAIWTVPRSLLLFRWATSTFDAFLDTCTQDARLRAVLTGQHGDYALPPSRVSVVIGIGLAAHYLEGAYFPKGGGQVISDALAASIEAHGGKILLRTKAEKILVENGRVTGVLLSNKRFGERVVRAPIVISNADLKRTMKDLIGSPHVSQGTLARVAGFEMSAALGAVYLGVRGDLKAEGHRRTNYWIYPSVDANPGYEVNARGEFSKDPFVFVSIASLKDPTNTRLAPEGISNLQLMSLAPSQPEAWGTTEAELESGAYRDNPSYLAKKEAYASSLIAAAERMLPGLRERIVFQEVATSLTHRRFTGSTGGTSYGIALTPQQFLWNRPDAKTEIEGLYLCGASCRSGHGIAGVMMSGLVAAAAIVGSRLMRDVLGARPDA